LPGIAKNMVIIPREIDLLIERASRLLGFSLNAALQDRFELSELVELM
jgi:spore protease